MGTLKNSIRRNFSFIILVVPAFVYAAKTTNFEKKKALVQDIELIQSIINENNLKTNGLLGEIDYLEYQVIAAQKIIRLIENQEQMSGYDLVQLGEQLTVLKQEKENAIKQYQSILLEEYKNRDYKAKLYFLASSKNLSEFVNRLNHLNTLKEFRKKQLRAILNKEKEVSDKLSVYKGNATEKNKISKDKIEQIAKLSEILRLQHQKYSELTTQTQELTLEIKGKKEALESFNTQIKETIKNTQVNADLSKELPKLNLKWPVKKGLLVSRFGIHKHSKERKVKIENNGIDVLVSPNEKIFATQNGRIKAILEVPGSNYCILLDHGSYYSVFSNVQNVMVPLGAEVKIGDQLAEIATNTDGQTKLHFELWQGTTKLDPEQYLEGSLH
jgi:murein hydrolase activator